jgi:hypothetical protein
MPCIAVLGRIAIDPFFRQCGGGGGSSGGGGGLTNQQAETQAFRLAEQWLKKPACRQLFGAFDPSVVLQGLDATGSFSIFPNSITLSFVAFPFGVTSVDAYTFPGLNLQIPGVYGITATILVNTNAFITGAGAATEISDLADTILHELGHAYNFVPSFGGSQIVFDSPVLFPSGQAANENLISTDCEGGQ